MATTDDRVVLPDAIKRKIATGEQRFKQFTGQTPSDQASAEPGPIRPPVQNPPAEPTPDHPPPTPEPEPPLAAVPMPAAQADNQDPPLAATQADVAKLQRALSTLQGKYNAETAGFRHEVTALSTRNADLLQHIELLRRELDTGKEEKKNLTHRNGHGTVQFSDDDKEQFGEPILNLVSRMAQQIAGDLVSAKMAELQGKIDQLDGSVNQIDQRHLSTRAERFKKYMDDNCGLDWDAVDNSPEFAAWLDQIDPFSGQKRADGLRAAIQAEQFGRAVLIFKGYARETTATAQPPAPRRTRLETLAEPSNGGRGRTEAIVDQNAPKVPPTQEEIRAFYKRCSDPRFRDKVSAAEIAEFEARMIDGVRRNAIQVIPRT